MKKIAFIVAVPGTARSFLLDHMKSLMRDYKVHLVANFSDEISKKEFIDAGIVCHHIPIQRGINVIADIRGLFSLCRLLLKEKFDCVHSVTPKAGLLTAVAGFFAGIPIRIHIFTGQVWATRMGIMRVLLKLMDKITASFATNILVDGESQRQFLIREHVLTENNSRVLANGSITGVKLERFNISSQIRRQERVALGIDDDDVVYIFLGRLNHDKGIGELYEVFNKLAAEKSNVKLLFYGSDEGGYIEKVKSYPHIVLGKNFYFPGRTKKPFEALQAGDVFVLPTWREGFGSSVIEAQALALPVITSDAYGVVDASVPGVTGLRCRVNDPDGLYKCMKAYYDNPDMREQHGIAGRERVIEKFDCNVVTAAWVAYYKELLCEV